MLSDNKRSGLRLCAAGLVGLVFFWLTDPKWGPIGRRINADDLIDAMNFGRYGTFVGLAGSAVVLFIGVWLMMRRTV